MLCTSRNCWRITARQDHSVIMTDNIVAVAVLSVVAVAYAFRPTRWSALALAITSCVTFAFVVYKTGPRVRVIVDTSADQSESFRAGVLALNNAVRPLNDLVMLHCIILSVAFIAREWCRRKEK